MTPDEVRSMLLRVVAESCSRMISGAGSSESVLMAVRSYVEFSYSAEYQRLSAAGVNGMVTP